MALRGCFPILIRSNFPVILAPSGRGHPHPVIVIRHKHTKISDQIGSYGDFLHNPGIQLPGLAYLNALSRLPLHFLSPKQFSGGNSEWVPPDPFSNSEVKTLSADGSVGPFASLRVRPLGCTLVAFAHPCAAKTPPGFIYERPPPVSGSGFFNAPDACQ